MHGIATIMETVIQTLSPMKMKSMKQVVVLHAVMLALTGCIQSTVSSPKPDVLSAISFVKQAYPGVGVVKIDENTIGLTWESGAEDVFQKLKTTVEEKFAVTPIITAIE